MSNSASGTLKSSTDALSDEQKAATTKRIWQMVLKNPEWMLLGCSGAIVFGAIFPGWGMLLANTQNMFYQTPHVLRVQSREFALYYLLLAGTALVSSVAQFYGMAQVH